MLKAFVSVASSLLVVSGIEIGCVKSSPSTRNASSRKIVPAEQITTIPKFVNSTEIQPSVTSVANAALILDDERKIASFREAEEQEKICSKTVKNVHSTLEKAAASSQQLRIRITLLSMVLGFVPLFGGIAMLFLIGSVLDESEVGKGEYYASVAPWGLFLTALAVMPTDTGFVKFLNGLFVVCLSLVTIFNFHSFVLDFSGQQEIPKENPDDITVYACGDVNDTYSWAMNFTVAILAQGIKWVKLGNEEVITASNAVCMLTISKTLIAGTGFSIGTVFLLRNIARLIKGLSSREALINLWFYGRVIVTFTGTYFLVFAIAYHAIGDKAPWYSTEEFAAQLVFSSSCILSGVFFNDERRHFIMGTLQSINAEGEVMSAASIAALLGDHCPSESLEMAKAKFRSICFERLEEKDFAGNRERESQKNALFDKTNEQKLGCCDAFISHSWSDDGKKKYEALEAWSEAFKLKNGRYPELWLDKACINQSDISNDLLCLPMFLAGCGTLLIIAGPSYTSRLWCIMEVFVFLMMGGSTERITVIPIDMTEEKAKRVFDSVDVMKCHCFKDEDKQKLLGVIEIGFGSFSGFNHVVRQVFQERAFRKFTFTSELHLRIRQKSSKFKKTLISIGGSWRGQRNLNSLGGSKRDLNSLGGSKRDLLVSQRSLKSIGKGGSARVRVLSQLGSSWRQPSQKLEPGKPPAAAAKRRTSATKDDNTDVTLITDDQLLGVVKEGSFAKGGSDRFASRGKNQAQRPVSLTLTRVESLE